MAKTYSQKNISMNTELLDQLEALCSVFETNVSAKAIELLFEWKLNELDRLQSKAPDLYAIYLQNLANKPVKKPRGKNAHKRP